MDRKIYIKPDMVLLTMDVMPFMAGSNPSPEVTDESGFTKSVDDDDGSLEVGSLAPKGGFWSWNEE